MIHLRAPLFCTLALTLLLAACSSTPEPEAPAGTAGVAAAAAPTVQFHIQALPSEEADSVLEQQPGGPELRLLPAQRFRVAAAAAAVDAFGLPAVEVTLAPEDVARFHAWTGSNVDRQLVWVHEGEVLLVATINEALGDRVLLRGGVNGFNEAEVARLVEAWSPAAG